jgi:hypothetical protein
MVFRLTQPYQAEMYEKIRGTKELAARQICAVLAVYLVFAIAQQEFCSPSLQPSHRCKTHASLPTRTLP